VFVEPRPQGWPALLVPVVDRCTTGTSTTRWLVVDGSIGNARKALARARADAGSVRRTTGGAETLDASARRWFIAREKTIRPATLKLYDTAYRTTIHPTLGSVPLDNLTRERLEGWVAGLLRRGSASPRRRARREDTLGTAQHSR
jgi:hypothetical protein